MRPGDVVDRKAHGDTVLTVVLEQKPGLYRVDGEDLHRSAWLQQWSKPTSLRLRAPGASFPFLGKDDVITLPRKGKKWGDGFRLRKKGRGLYAKGGLERGDLVVTVRRRSLRGSLAVLAARLSPLVAVITAIQNRTRTIQQARRARDLAKKHGPGILEASRPFWRRGARLRRPRECTRRRAGDAVIKYNVHVLVLQNMARVEHPQHGPVIDIAVRLTEVVADLIRLLP